MNGVPLDQVGDGSGSADFAVLERHLAEARRALQAVAGDRSMCAIGRSGQSFPAAKYHEGAVSALTELRRLLRQRQAQGEMVDVASAAARVADTWRGRAESRVAAGPDWRAYFAGGVEALAALETSSGR